MLLHEKSYSLFEIFFPVKIILVAIRALFLQMMSAESLYGILALCLMVAYQSI